MENAKGTKGDKRWMKKYTPVHEEEVSEESTLKKRRKALNFENEGAGTEEKD